VLSGRTRFTAIFGDPVDHSLSPAMHNAAYNALGVERAYVAFHVTPDGLVRAIRSIPALGILGVNLTVPHKGAAVRLMAHLSDEARTLRAVNCVINCSGELHGDNTDARGLELDLRELGVMIAGRQVIVVGAGGAAASAILACIRLGAKTIVLCNRTAARAKSLARRFRDYKPADAHDFAIDARPLDALLDQRTLGAAAAVINATPMGLKTAGFTQLDYKSTDPDCVFYDLIYAREPTPFLAPAMALGRRAVDGAGMLVNQGVLAFELFNGFAPPPGVMRGALMSALGRA